MSLRKIFVFVLLSAPMLVLAQDNGGPAGMRKQIASKDQTREFTEQFLNTLVTARPFDAFAMMRNAAPDSEAEIDAERQATEDLILQVRQGYGRAIGFEWLDTRSLGQSFVRYDYLVKFERNAVHCRVIYYRPRNTWLPVMLHFSQDLTQLYEDLGK